MILLSVVIMQITIVPFLGIGQIVPNVVLVLSLFWVVFKKFENTWRWIVVIGLLFDLFSGLPFGVIIISLLLAVYLIDLLNINFFAVKKIWIIILLTLLGTIIYNISVFLLARFFRVEIVFNFRYLLSEIIYNSVIAIILYYVFKKIFYKA